MEIKPEEMIERMIKGMHSFVYDSPTAEIMEIKMKILEVTLEEMKVKVGLIKPLVKRMEQKACVPCPQCGENEINKLPFDNHLPGQDHEDVMVEWVTCLSCKNRYQPGAIQKKRQNALSN